MAKNLDVVLLTDYYGEMLTDNQRKFLDYYYNDDLSLSEIAENEGITRQGVRDAIKRAEAQLFEVGRAGACRDRSADHRRDRAGVPPLVCGQAV